MKYSVLSFTLVCVVTACLASSAFGQSPDDPLDDPGGERRAQTGMKFLQVSVDPRASAMAGAVTAGGGSSASLFYNPAGMADMNSNAHVQLGQTQWIGDYTYNSASAAFRPAGGRYGVVGLSIVAVDYGSFIGTVRANNEQGFEELGDFSPSAMAIGVGYARALTDRFSVGGQAKYATQDLGSAVIGFDESGGYEREDYSAGTVAFDFGVLYKTGFRSLNFAVAARNFSRELTYAIESFELPLTFRIGVAMDLMDFARLDQSMHSLSISVDAERPRDYSERLRVGGEYVFLNTLALRAGYIFPADEEGVSLGAGLQRGIGGIGLGINYAYTQFGILGNVNRFGLEISF